MAVCGLTLLLFFTLCGCGAQRQTGEWFAMDTVMTAAVYGSADALDAVEAETYRLDALLAAQKDDSEIAAVNDGAEVVSEETAALLRRALEIAAETNGAYDPTVYPLMRAMGLHGWKLPRASRCGTGRAAANDRLDRSLRGRDNGLAAGRLCARSRRHRQGLCRRALQGDFESTRRDVRAAEPRRERLGARQQAGRHGLDGRD